MKCKSVFKGITVGAKQSFLFSQCIVLFLFFAMVACAPAEPTIVILHTNDTHGYDEYGDGHNGMAVIASLKEKLEADGYQVLLLDAGDAIQDNNLVNFSKGKSAIQFMNAAGYDAATLGNHEFDYGQDILKERMSEALFPYVAANIRIEANGKNFIRPYTIDSLIITRHAGYKMIIDNIIY